MNYFTHRITNARAEGISSNIALIEKMTYGYRNKEHLKTAIYFRCGNLQLYP
ncbi:MAG: transposase [Thermoplasmata archaeon]